MPAFGKPPASLVVIASMPLNSFRPIHEAHSIAEQMAFFQFTPPFNREMQTLLALKDELRDELPVSEVLKSFQVEFTDGSLPSQEMKDGAGLQLSRFSPKGTLSWTVNIVPESISFHCTEYTRWNEVWDVHQRHIQSVFSKLSGTKSFLTSVGSKWVDQFIYEGKDEDYNSLDLLRQSSRYLSPSVFASGPRWHCHTGWFDRDSWPDRGVLNQLNIASSSINIEGRMRTAVTIDHTLQVRAIDRIDQLADLLPITETGFKSLSDLMETLHSGNKRVLADVLNDSAGERIGLR